MVAAIATATEQSVRRAIKDCDEHPPIISYATFKAHTYKKGTLIDCECKKGFRRIRNGSIYLLCIGNSSWANKCQCVSASSRNTSEQVTPQPEEHKEKSSTEMQSQVQPVEKVNLPGECWEPPAWKHEAANRTYHFKVGQIVRYECIQGYKAIQTSPVISVCKMTCGKTKWTWPQITCINESKLHLFAGQEDSPASTDALPESKASCPTTSTGMERSHEDRSSLIKAKSGKGRPFLTYTIAADGQGGKEKPTPAVPSRAGTGLINLHTSLKVSERNHQVGSS
ncbi:Interleukin-2 receptor alpha chain [Heterocephalus glaber]|uniref:Interleukin-2 receptor subunit alpha n=1 Tax=Heterocephalus glaber TaxID=10181 RepID=G5BP95_HETGA|nr:Interleukin-2 receptor alpha chain [Heterocephalus glaber]